MYRSLPCMLSTPVDPTLRCWPCIALPTAMSTHPPTPLSLQEATLRLTQHSGLVECLLGEFTRLVSRAVDPSTGVVTGESPELKGDLCLDWGTHVCGLLFLRLFAVRSRCGQVLHCASERQQHCTCARGLGQQRECAQLTAQLTAQLHAGQAWPDMAACCACCHSSAPSQTLQLHFSVS